MMFETGKFMHHICVIGQYTSFTHTVIKTVSYEKFYFLNTCRQPNSVPRCQFSILESITPRQQYHESKILTPRVWAKLTEDHNMIINSIATVNFFWSVQDNFCTKMSWLSTFTLTKNIPTELLGYMWQMKFSRESKP